MKSLLISTWYSEWISRCDDVLFAALAEIATLSRQLKWQPPKTSGEIAQADQILRNIYQRNLRGKQGSDSGRLFTLTLNVSVLVLRHTYEY